MRKLVQVAIISDRYINEYGTRVQPCELLGLDDDGYLWMGQIGEQNDKRDGAFDCIWTAIEGPGDGEPFMDSRDRLTQIEDTIREANQQREDIFAATEDGVDPETAGEPTGDDTGDD